LYGSAGVTTKGPPILLHSSPDLDNPTTIQHVSTATGMRTLGIRLALDGNDNNEFAYHLQQATKMHQHIKTAPLGREYIWIGFRAIWQMMIQYPLGATCLTVQQCAKIQAKYLPTFLSKMGINLNYMTTTAVRHRPRYLGGMQNFHPETKQGIQHMKLVLAHEEK
jgi:hypothetical protein